MVKGLRSPGVMELELMHTYAAAPRQTFWKLRVPASLPFLFPSLRVAIAAGLVGAIVGELPTGAQAGLGARLLTGSYYGNTVQIWSALVMAALLGLVLTGAVAWAEKLRSRPGGQQVTRCWRCSAAGVWAALRAVGMALAGQAVALGASACCWSCWPLLAVVSLRRLAALDPKGWQVRFATPLLFGVWVLVFWELLTQGFDVPKVLLPAPSADLGLAAAAARPRWRPTSCRPCCTRC